MDGFDDGDAVAAARSAMVRRWRSTVVRDDEGWVVRTWTGTAPEDSRPTGPPDVVHRVHAREGELVVEQVHPDS